MAANDKQEGFCGTIDNHGPHTWHLDRSGNPVRCQGWGEGRVRDMPCRQVEPHELHTWQLHGTELRCKGVPQPVDESRRLVQCPRNYPHERHAWVDTDEAYTCPGREDMTKHENLTVRWQALMEDHMAQVRALTSEAMKLGTIPQAAQSLAVQHNAKLRAQLAQANANAALALAIALSAGDLEVALAKLNENLHGLVD